MSTEPSWQQIAQRLEMLARARGDGKLSEAGFVALLLELEASEVKSAGLTLMISHTLDDWTVVQLHRRKPKEVCASFEFLPETGAFREPGSGPC